MSIRTRLTLWYTGLLAISLLTFGVLLYSLLAGVLMAVLDGRLGSQAQYVTGLIQAQSDPQKTLMSGHVPLPTTAAFASQYYIQILAADGHILQLSENLRRQQSLPVPADIKADMAAGHNRSYTAPIGGNVQLRVYSMPIVINEETIGAVQVGQNLTDLYDSLSAVRSTILLGSVVALLLAALGGMILARAALRPIEAITKTARQITATQDLGQRIPVSVPSDELGRLTGTINEMVARLEVLFQAQQRLVTDVSHDLRTPLTTIRGNLDLLQRGAAEEPAMRAQALRAIGDETERMSRLLNDLLLLAQADAGLQLHRQPVEMDTLLLDAYRQAQVMAQGVTVKLGAEDQAQVAGDVDRLRQLLLNLVDNALKYTPAGGQVTLTLERDRGWVHLSVADTGIGIAPEHLPHIFDRFYRADRSRTRGGSGLGLSIAQWIARAHGGRLGVTSEVGKGSTFTLSLPEYAADEQSIARKVET